jgi:tetratricopeptide (TPR) repeat protein
MENGHGIRRALPHAAWLWMAVLCGRGAAQERRPPEYLNTRQAMYGLVLLVARPMEQARAEAALQQAVKLGSNSIEARLRLAGLRLEEERPDDAVQLCQDVINLDPYLPAAHLRLARAYGMLGDHEKTVSTLERVLGFDPGNESARRALDAERNAGSAR